MEAMRNSESVAAGFLDSTSSCPNASRCATRPRRADERNGAGYLSRLDLALDGFADAAEALAREADFSGFARGVAAGTGQDSRIRLAHASPSIAAGAIQAGTWAQMLAQRLEYR